jgi:hypothetical protein
LSIYSWKLDIGQKRKVDRFTRVFFYRADLPNWASLTGASFYKSIGHTKIDFAEWAFRAIDVHVI